MGQLPLEGSSDGSPFKIWQRFIIADAKGSVAAKKKKALKLIAVNETFRTKKSKKSIRGLPAYCTPAGIVNGIEVTPALRAILQRDRYELRLVIDESFSRGLGVYYEAALIIKRREKKRVVEIAHVVVRLFPRKLEETTPVANKTWRTEAYVASVVVEKPYRGKGYAGILLDTWLRFFDHYGLDASLTAMPLVATREATISIEDLVGFYKKGGFVPEVKKVKGLKEVQMLRKIRRAAPVTVTTGRPVAVASFKARDLVRAAAEVGL